MGGGGEGGDGWHVGLQLPIDRAEVDVGSTLAPHTFLLKPLRGPTSSPVRFDRVSIKPSVKADLAVYSYLYCHCVRLMFKLLYNIKWISFMF